MVVEGYSEEEEGEDEREGREGEDEGEDEGEKLEQEKEDETIKREELDRVDSDIELLKVIITSSCFIYLIMTSLSYDVIT